MQAKERRRFVRKITRLLLSLGAKQDGDDNYRFTLETKAGRLRLHPDVDQREGPGTVFGRFDNPEAARQLVDCNRFSGKWNHHYFSNWSVESAINDLCFQLKKVLD
jgi:hypothetical protein